MKITLFLGAGASAFASQPTTKELLELLRDRVQKRKNYMNRNSVLQEYAERVVGAKAYDDLEKLYDGLQTMIDIHDYPNCKPITKEIHYYNHKEKHLFTYEEIVNEMKELQSITRETLLDSFKIKPDAHKSIGKMYDMVWSTIEENGDDQFWVFTTNYDLVMETYAKERGLEIVNGFGPPNDLIKEWARTWRRNTDKPPLYLAKLHGSIHWYRKDGVIVETGAPAWRDAKNDIMIAPTEGTKSYDDEPFSTMMGRFKDALLDTDALLTIGFSYRDKEIVRVIKERLADGMTLISFSPDAASDIRRIIGADAKIVDVNVSMGISIVADSRIILCKQWFNPDIVNDVSIMLAAAYSIIKRQQSNDPVPWPQTAGTDDQN